MINFLTGIDVQGNIDLNRNELLEPRIENQSSDPAAGGEGQLYFNTTSDKLMLYANGAWVAMESGGDSNTTYDLNGIGSSNATNSTSFCSHQNSHDFLEISIHSCPPYFSLNSSGYSLQSNTVLILFNSLV